jgi:hypothetical protein
MLQVWSQESYLYYKVQEVPRQPNEAKEQDTGSQEVSKQSLDVFLTSSIEQLLLSNIVPVTVL